MKVFGLTMMTPVQIILTGVAAVFYIFFYLAHRNIYVDNLTFNVPKKSFTLTDVTGNEIVRGDFAVGSDLDASYVYGLNLGNPPNVFDGSSWMWSGLMKLQLHHFEWDGHMDDHNCYEVRWIALREDITPHDCIHTGGHHWYGGAETYHQRLALQKVNISMQPYLSKDLLQDNGAYGSVMERYWLSSNGVTLEVYPDDVPLHVSQDSQRICFRADYSGAHYSRVGKKKLMPSLVYVICHAHDVLAAHKQKRRYEHKLDGSPDFSLFANPIWSTWAKYKTNITQEKVIQFTEDIINHGFKACQIEIDDKYTTNYGDHVFDPIKFPDPEEMTRIVHDHGVNITAWLTPFANIDTEAFQIGAAAGYWVKDATGNVPGLIKWWQGTGGILDFTNDEAVEWFFSLIKPLQDIGIDSFKFDAGEIGFLPPSFKTNWYLEDPSYFTHYYMSAVYAHMDSRIEVRAAYKDSYYINLPVFVRVMDKLSHWGYDMGLKSLIPNVLQMGLVGFPFILPDMIGGNAYAEDDFSATILPDKELYIRWLQASLHMPALQFSIAPWQYDAETTRLSLELLAHREHYILPRLMAAVQESVATGGGYPIIRPLWWADPQNPALWDVDSQYLLGLDLVVAPVLEQGAVSRDIHIPKGTWRDGRTGEFIIGYTYLKDYHCPLSCLPYFERIIE